MKNNFPPYAKINHHLCQKKLLSKLNCGFKMFWTTAAQKKVLRVGFSDGGKAGKEGDEGVAEGNVQEGDTYTYKNIIVEKEGPSQSHLFCRNTY